MGILAFLAAALAGFVFGAVWYMTLAKPWMEASGVPINDQGQPVNSSTPLPYVTSAVTMILVAGMMRHVFFMGGIDGTGEALVSGLGVGAFFITPWIAMNNGYSMRPVKLTVIDAGYAILGCGIIGLVLSLFS